MANKLISINTEKAPGTQLPGVVQQEIVAQLVPRVTNPLAASVTLLRTELDALTATVAGGGGGQTGGGTVDTAAVQALIDTAVAGFVTEDYLSGVVGPAIQQAVASQVNKINDRLTLNSTKADDSPVVVETNNMTGAQHKVGIDFVTQRDGQVTVNGKRVLTEDDAISAGGVDAVALNNQLLLLQSRIDDLEAEMVEKVTMANVQGLLTGFATAQQMTALTGRVTDLEGSTALRQARWVTEALTGDTTANSTQINNAVAGLARTAFVQEQLANATAYVDQLSSDVAGALDQVRVEYTQLVDDMVTWAATAFTGKDQFQALLDAMNGPNADIPMIANMFRLLNDVIMALLDATGVPVPEDSKQAAEVMREKQQEEMRNLLTAGNTVPANVDWTATVLADTSYVGLVEFRCINGTVQFRGSLKGPSPTAGTYRTVRALTVALMDYKPVLEINTTAFAVETGKQYRVAAVRFTTDGRIAISAPTGSFDTIQFDGLSYQVF